MLKLSPQSGRRQWRNSQGWPMTRDSGMGTSLVAAILVYFVYAAQPSEWPRGLGAVRTPDQHVARRSLVLRQSCEWAAFDRVAARWAPDDDHQALSNMPAGEGRGGHHRDRLAVLKVDTADHRPSALHSLSATRATTRPTRSSRSAIRSANSPT